MAWQLGERGGAYRRQTSRRSSGRASVQHVAAQVGMITTLASKAGPDQADQPLLFPSGPTADGVRPCGQHFGMADAKDAGQQDQTAPAKNWRRAAMAPPLS